jgi:putative ABC transport system permease protein
VYSFGPLPPPVVAAVTAHPKVASTSGASFTMGAALLDGGARSSPIGIAAIDPATYFTSSSFSYVEGGRATTIEALGAGGHVLVTRLLADHLHLHRGAAIDLQTAHGPKRFVVEGVIDGFAQEQTAVLAFRDAGPSFGLTVPQALAVDLVPGADALQVRRELLATIAAGEKSSRRSGSPFSVGLAAAGIGISVASESKAAAHDQLDRYLRLFYAVLGVAVVAGMLGLANTLAMAVVQRRRELGLLRALGAERRALALMVVAESATLVGVATFLAIPLGAVLGTAVVRGTGAGVGSNVSYAFPWATLGTLIVLSLGIGVLAALAPARRASRLQPIVALRVD